MDRQAAGGDSDGQVAAGDSDRRAAAGDPSAGYWSLIDPTPLTPVNEAQVEHWRRLVLADLIYGRPEKELRGWETPRGDLFVRYGPPQSLVFVHGGWAGGEAADGGEGEPAMNPVREMQRHYGEGRSVLPFEPPQQRWNYHIGGRDLSFRLEDQSLQDDFVPADGIRFAEQQHETPAVLLEETQGRVPIFYFASSGRRGPPGSTRQTLALSIPLGTAEEDWLTAGRQSVRILDPAGREIFAAEGAAGPEAVRRPRSDLPMLVLHGEAPLAAGHYTAEIALESPRAYAGITVPLDVRRFGIDSLTVSDLELCFPPDIPNPGGLVVPGVGLQVRFDVYNLVPLRDDVVRYRNRYVILPRTYAVAAARLIQEGRGEDPAIRFGAAGRELGGVTLHERNYADVSFPPAGARLARSGRGAFTFEVDAARMDPGEYALVLRVEDLSTGRSALAQAAIRVLTAEQVEEIGEGE